MEVLNLWKELLMWKLWNYRNCLRLQWPLDFHSGFWPHLVSWPSARAPLCPKLSHGHTVCKDWSLISSPTSHYNVIMFTFCRLFTCLTSTCDGSYSPTRVSSVSLSEVQTGIEATTCMFLLAQRKPALHPINTDNSCVERGAGVSAAFWYTVSSVV